jgi:hypothetical protein
MCEALLLTVTVTARVTVPYIWELDMQTSSASVEWVVQSVYHENVWYGPKYKFRSFELDFA